MHHEQELQNSCNSVFPRYMVCLRCVSVNTLYKGKALLLLLLLLLLFWCGSTLSLTSASAALPPGNKPGTLCSVIRRIKCSQLNTSGDAILRLIFSLKVVELNV